MAKGGSLLYAIVGIVVMAFMVGVIATQDNNETGSAAAAGYYCIKCYYGVPLECYYLSTSTAADLRDWGNEYCSGAGGYTGIITLQSARSHGYALDVN